MTKTEPEGHVVLLGNPNPQMQEPIYETITETDEDGNETTSTRDTGHTRSVPAKHLTKTTTEISLWPGIDSKETVAHALSTDNDRMLGLIARFLQTQSKDDTNYAIVVAELEQIIGVHAAGARPDWISSPGNPDLQRALAEYFDCPQGEPQALLTNVGRDALHKQHLDTAAQPAAFNYMALADNASATTPAVSNTTLAGEITTAGGGLVRAQGTFAHTTGTNTSTLTKTFTANGSDALPVTVSQVGIFNASTVGTLGYKTALSSNATLTTSGDNTTVTWTDTAG